MKLREDDISEFLELVDRIYNSSYIQKHQDQNVELNWKQGEPLLINSSSRPDREGVESFLMRMRPIYSPKERLYLVKVIDYLIENSKEEEEIEILTKYKIAVSNYINRKLFSIKSDGKEYGMQDFVWLYLYGEYFHRDKKKLKILSQFEEVFGPMVEVSALSQLEVFASFAMVVARFINKKRGNK